MRRMKDRRIAKEPFKPGPKSSKGRWWVFFIWIFTFVTSSLFTLAMSKVMKSANLVIAVITLLIIILLNICFDIIGTAVTAADEIPFNSMAARKVYGAKTAIMLIRNADRVSNFCNDVIGDIFGIISGSIITYIIIKIGGLIDLRNAVEIYTEALLGGFVSALTVGGKSLGKSVAINNCNSVIYKVAVVIQIFKRK